MQFKFDTKASGPKEEARQRSEVQQEVTGQSQNGEKIHATNRQGEHNNLRRINQSHAKGKQETHQNTKTIYEERLSGAGLNTQGNKTQVKHISNQEKGTKRASEINYNSMEHRTFKIKQEAYKKTYNTKSDR